MLHYILQTVAFQVFFLIIYDVFLKNETFFNWNRVYLIGTAFLSFTLPFLKFESIKAIVPEPMVVRLPEVIIGEVSPLFYGETVLIQTGTLSEQTMNFSWASMWTVLWISGMVLAALFLSYKMLMIIRMFYKSPQRWQGDALIVFLLNSSAAFSFFHYIFLGTDIQSDKKEHIIQHEMVHVKERHSLDLLAFEILRIIFWFNPLIYMYQNRTATLHEFIADAKAVKYKGKSEYYQNLLSQVFETQNISFINPFFKQSLIKKRIIMLSKSKSKQIHLIKYAILAPVVLAMLMYTSSYASAAKDPFPSVQKEMVHQELTFQELVEKYYNEIIALKDSKGNLSEILESYFKSEDKYIENRDVVARNQAYMNYMFTEIMEKKETDGELTDAEKDKYGKRINRYKTYEEYLAYKEKDKAKRTWESLASGGEIRMVVDKMGKLTDAEKKLQSEKMALIKSDDFYHTLKMTDGKMITIVDFGKKDKDGNRTPFEPEDIEVPYAVIEEVPFFKGCEPSGSREKDKQCTSDNISRFVNENFNTNLATALGLKGKQRISVIFKIGKDGKVTDVKSRAPHPGLEAEAIRVIELMPNFTPGKQRGKAVTVPYSLPILFQVQDDSPETNKNKNENSESGETEVSYVALDEIPIFSGGQPTASIESDRESTSANVSRFVNKNFNTQVGKEHDLTGKQRISVIFKIGADGKVRNVKARASHPALEAEAIRVIELMPDFTPGKKNGKAVTVPYSLPILFQIQEDAPETDTTNNENSESGETEVSYVALDEVPIFSGGQPTASIKSDRESTSANVSRFVNKNFNTQVGKEHDLTGKQRISVIFKIGSDGKVRNVKARASHPALEAEAIRVIELMPDFTPGKKNGKAVTVPYSLPILFQIQEDVPEKKSEGN